MQITVSMSENDSKFPGPRVLRHGVDRGRGANAQASPVYSVSISIIYCVCPFCDDGLPTTFKAASVQALERVQKRRPNRYKQRAHKVP